MFLSKEGIDINISYGDKGILIESFYYKGKNKQPIIFPLGGNHEILNKIIKLDKYHSIFLLEDLWLEDILKTSKDDYIIYYENLYDVERQVAEELNLPLVKDIKIILKSNYFIGSKEFDIGYSLEDENLNKLDGFHRRYGNVIEFDGKHFLLDKEQYKLIEEIDNYEKTDDLTNQGIFLAKVKKKAGKAGAQVDDYIKNEEYFFPETLNLDIVKHSDVHLELIPSFNELDDKSNEILSEEKSISAINSFSLDSKRHRVFLNEDLGRDFNHINQVRDIKDSQVPRFLNNPFEILPESIDLDQFGERVKGLKIRTYRAQPFVYCKEDADTGWFDFDTGVEIKKETEIDDEEDVKNDKLIDLDKYRDIVNEAQKTGEDYIYFDNKWIKVDAQQGKEFLDAEREISSKFKDKKVDIKNLNYILDIYDNIERLEYSTNLVRLKQDLYSKCLVKYEKPKFFNANLYEYQQEGFMWLKFLRYEKLGGLLADDMGLGKTLQIIAFMAFLKEAGEFKPSLVVVPSALIDNWKSEIEKFTYNLRDIYIHRGPHRVKESSYIRNKDITITTYETLVRDQMILGKVDWNLLVIDEAQKIKNSSTLASSAVKAMKSKYPIALTGTPVENSLSELWSIVDFVQPGLLGSYSVFKEQFQIPIEENIDNEGLILRRKDELINKIEPIFLRRTKEDKLDNLPKKDEIVIPCSLSEEQEIAYYEIIEKVKKGEAKGCILACLQELIQICSHPRLVEGDVNGKTDTLIAESYKLAETINLLAEINKLGEKVIIFTKYKKMQEILRKVIFDKFGVLSPVINGDMNKNRLEIIEDFETKKGFNVMLLSPRAAGVGLNIVGANHVIHYTREWNPAVENQGTDRVYRIGQEKDVKVYYPICISDKGKTVEVKLNELLEKKKKLVKEVVIPMDKLNITEEDFMDII
ncbi:DEAD/DEAH box helicase [Sporanaerobacter acetigenes]|uniref:DEAD/DEAH box helicase n=1 Tax=Sporanaerobacter acetigenes TaxID=165813 RepID=UPI0010477FB1|nr:DEAD/DEAH box helicase [Sporanaerobacter acetigenes]